MCVVGVHAAESGKRHCNVLLFRGSASIEPRSMKLIGVCERRRCRHTVLCPRAWCVFASVSADKCAWSCACFFGLTILCCSLAEVRWWVVRGYFPWRHEHTCTGHCTYLDQMERGEVVCACFLSLWMIITIRRRVEHLPHGFDSDALLVWVCCGQRQLSLRLNKMNTIISFSLSDYPLLPPLFQWPCR